MKTYKVFYIVLVIQVITFLYTALVMRNVLSALIWAIVSILTAITAYLLKQKDNHG